MSDGPDPRDEHLDGQPDGQPDGKPDEQPDEHAEASDARESPEPASDHLEPAALLGPDGPVARRLDGYEPRAPQIEMAEAVTRTLAARGTLLVEAGTGVGKSFAYLAPAIHRVVEHGERVVIATGTINLQEQLLDKDVPLLNAVIPEEFSAVLVKGRGNYLSLRRLKLASERQDRLLSDDVERRSLHRIEDWAYGTTDGTLSTLPQLERPSVWDHARSDAGNCMGRRCPTYKECFYQRARRRMEHGRLLICNHALFFSDLALRARGVGFLPPYDHVIIDEAHGIEDVASEHFGLSLAEGRVAHLLRLLHHPRTHRGFLGALAIDPDHHALLDRTIEQVIACQDAADRLFDDLEGWRERSAPANGRIEEPEVVANRFSGPLRDLAGMLRQLKGHATREADEYELTSYATRASELALAADALIEQRLDGCVYWVETSGRERGGREKRPRLSIRCMAVDVAPILREHLYDQDVGVTLTSATLTIGDRGFEHVQRRFGCPDAEVLAVGSPFDYASQMEVLVDDSMPEPASSAYETELVGRIADQAIETNGGMFVLFTSFELLRRTTERLRPRLEPFDIPVLEHGADGPPNALLTRFRNSGRAVLMGTGRFWQGVDVRGPALRSVVITRLPFAVPDQPLQQARHELIRARGGNPFLEDQVPRAVIRFRQGVGRLIRSTTDAGRIVILDARVRTKPYGRLFIASLPAGTAVGRLRPPGDASVGST